MYHTSVPPSPFISPVPGVSYLLTSKPTAHQLPSISWVYEFIPVHKFPETCLSIYLTENYNEADFVMVNACLHYLFETYSYQLAGEERAEYHRLSRLCGANLETALINLPLHLPANIDTITALLLGVCSFLPLPSYNIPSTR